MYDGKNKNNKMKLTLPVLEVKWVLLHIFIFLQIHNHVFLFTDAHQKPASTVVCNNKQNRVIKKKGAEKNFFCNVEKTVNKL